MAPTMTFAVIQTGGKQYRVAKDQIVEIERLPGEAGQSVEFKDVLMTGEGASVKIGAPNVAGAKVTGTITEVGRNAKVIVIKYKQKSRYFKKNGHRQPFFKVKIDTIISLGIAEGLSSDEIAQMIMEDEELGYAKMRATRIED